MIEVGDKVVCIEDHGFTDDYFYPNGIIEKGVVYNVENLKLMEFCDTEGEILCFYLTNKKRFWIEDNMDVPWLAKWFRKLEDIKMENELKRLKGQPVEI